MKSTKNSSRTSSKAVSAGKENWINSITGWLCLGLMLGSYVFPASIRALKSIGKNQRRAGK